MSFSVAITGTRGIPAKHGGFETFAEELAQFLVARGIDVTVYCQTDERRGQFRDQWNGVSRVGFGGVFSGAIGTVFFDLRTVLDVVRVRPDVVLTLGYNTAALCLLLKMFGIANVINMDGIEWRRAKWSRLAKVWFWLNEWIAAHIGDRLIADHPEIKRHLARHGVSDKTTVIPYGAHTVEETKSDVLEKLGLTRGEYFCVVARAEPENSILEIVSTFSERSRGNKLLVLGSFSEANAYHCAVKDAASADVVFGGPIYDREAIGFIRKHCLAYVHGHTVGGTNPSLVEALGAGAAVIAHSNPYNRWVASDAAVYFASPRELDVAFQLLIDRPKMVKEMRAAARLIHDERFQWKSVLGEYTALLSKMARDV